ncbi:MAG: TonB family protein [Phycisphaeraceae bacterium JB051]
MSSIAVYSTRTLQADYLQQSCENEQGSQRSMPAFVRWGLILAAAVMVNALIIWMLYSLNAMQLTMDSRQTPIITVMLNQQSQMQQDQQEPESEPQMQPEPMTVNLEMPDPTPPTPQLATLDLNMAMPEMSPVLVSVMTPPPAPKPVARTVTKTTPTPKPVTNRTYNSDQVDNPPRELAGNPQPEYPERELKRGRTGAVTVKLLINERGRVEDAQLVDHVGSSRFADSVMRVIKQFRFTPARHQGQVVKVWGIKTIRFQIGE